jgi:hypothetical protein
MTSLKQSSPRAALSAVQVPSTDTTAREVVYESEFISVWCYPDLGIVHHQMHKPCKSAHFRAALSAGVQAMETAGATCWLSDDRANGPVSDRDEQWGTTIWFQQAKAAGWLYWAMVVPEDAVGKLNVKRFVELYRKSGIESQMFSDPKPALDWLREQHARRTP